MDFHFEYLYDLKNEDLELNSLKEKKRILQAGIVLCCVILYYVVLFYSILFYSVLFYPNPLGNMAYQDMDLWTIRILMTHTENSAYAGQQLRSHFSCQSPAYMQSPGVTQCLGQNLHIEFRVLLL